MLHVNNIPLSSRPLYAELLQSSRNSSTSAVASSSENLHLLNQRSYRCLGVSKYAQACRATPCSAHERSVGADVTVGPSPADGQYIAAGWRH